MKNTDVAKSWINGKPAHSGHMQTDGRSIYSYQMKIGETGPNGEKWVLPFKGRSVTTTTHGNRCLSAGGAMKPGVQ